MIAVGMQSPDSTSARQGSVTSFFETSSSSAGVRDYSAHRERLSAFLQDQAFDVSSENSNDVGSLQTQQAREQRLEDLFASVDAPFQNAGAGNNANANNPNNPNDDARNNGSSSSSSSNNTDTQIRQQPHDQQHRQRNGLVRGTGEQFSK